MDKKTLVAEYDDYFRKNSHKWAEDDRNAFALDVLNKHVSSINKVLDVGCGNGHTLAYFMQHWDSKFYGIDLSPVACQIASETGAIIYTGFIEDMPPMKFDVILCMGVAEHFLDIVEGLKKIKSLLNGVLYLEVPDCLSYSPGEEGYRRLSVGSRQMEWHLSKKTWENKISTAGLQIKKCYEGKKPHWKMIWVLE